MRRIVTGGTGLIGQRLIKRWLEQGHEIVVIGRTLSHIHSLFGTKVQALTWQDITPSLFQSTEAVINLAGANVASVRWSDKRKEEVLKSRTHSTKTISELLGQLGQDAPLLLNASAIGIYGLQAQVANDLPPRLDENTEIEWNHAPDFLSHVAREWEKSAQPAINSGVRVVSLRFGIVLAKEGGALPKLILPFKFFLGGPIGTGEQPVSWISIDDVVKAINFLIEKSDATGPFNIVAPTCIKQREFAEAIGKALHRPSLLTTPALTMKLMLGRQMARELLLEGQHVYPKRLMDFKFTFSYPEIESAIKHILK